MAIKKTTDEEETALSEKEMQDAMAAAIEQKKQAKYSAMVEKGASIAA